MTTTFKRDNPDARTPVFRASLVAARGELHKLIEPPLGLNPMSEDYHEILDIITHLERLLGYE